MRSRPLLELQRKGTIEVQRRRVDLLVNVATDGRTSVAL